MLSQHPDNSENFKIKVFKKKFEEIFNGQNFNNNSFQKILRKYLKIELNISEQFQGSKESERE